MSSLKLANYVGVSTLLLLLGSTAQAQAATPPVGQLLFGEWDRLNSIGSPPAASEHEVMWQYWISPGNFACPWYRTFDEALAANPFPTHGDCVFPVTSP